MTITFFWMCDSSSNSPVSFTPKLSSWQLSFYFENQCLFSSTFLFTFSKIWRKISCFSPFILQIFFNSHHRQDSMKSTCRMKPPFSQRSVLSPLLLILSFSMFLSEIGFHFSTIYFVNDVPVQALESYHFSDSPSGIEVRLVLRSIRSTPPVIDFWAGWW